jgi:hypothetical protein
MRPFAGLAVCFASQLATAATFSDDFELNSLSRWPQLNQQTSVSLSTDSGAAHRGQFGLRLSDDNGATGSDTQGFVGLVPPPGITQYYFRFWLRIATPRVTGEFVVCEIESIPETAVSSVLDLRFTLTSAQVSLAGYDAAARYPEDGNTGFSLGSWHLVEGAMLGLGTRDGSRLLWLDGMRVATGTGRDFSGVSLGQLKLGEPYADTRSYRGDLDIDDFRAGTEPPASHLAVSVASTVAEGACVPVEVSLVDSDQVSAAAQYDVEATIQISGTALQLYADAQCVTELSGALLRTGDLRVTVYFRPEGSGEVTLTASHPDLLPGQQSTQISAGGVGGGGGDLGLTPVRGWGCQASPALGAFSGVVILLGRGRQRRARR